MSNDPAKTKPLASFLKVFNAKPKEELNDELIYAAGKDILTVVIWNFHGKLKTKKNQKVEFKPICILKEILDYPELIKKESEELDLSAFLNSAFEKETGKKWDPDKYVIVEVFTNFRTEGGYYPVYEVIVADRQVENKIIY